MTAATGRPLIAVWLGLLLLLAAGWPLVKTGITDQGNESSRFAAIESMVDRHTTAIDGSSFAPLRQATRSGISPAAATSFGAASPTAYNLLR